MVGDVFPSNLLESCSGTCTPANRRTEVIKSRIVEDVDPDRFQRDHRNRPSKGLAKKELNLSAIVGKSAEAKERRLVPEVIEEFFVQGGPRSGVHPKADRDQAHVYRVGKVPRNLMPIGDRQEPRSASWAGSTARSPSTRRHPDRTPPLNGSRPATRCSRRCARTSSTASDDHLQRGAVFFDLHRERPSVLDVFAASIKDGRGNTLHRRLFVVESSR